MYSCVTLVIYRSLFGMAVPLTTIWRTLMSPYLAFILTALVTFSGHSIGQNFDPMVEDNVYLNKIEKDIETEVNKTRIVFLKQALVLDLLAREFVAAQLKENLFAV